VRNVRVQFTPTAVQASAVRDAKAQTPIYSQYFYADMTP
jgi:hypothetical protein